MNKKDYAKVLVLALIFSVVTNVLFGRYLATKLSTLPVLNRWKIVSPLAPIVMTSKEIVRVSETGDILQVVNSTKPKLSTVMQVSGSDVKVLGGANNLTSEGLFLTTKVVVDAIPLDQLYIKLSDGTVSRVQSVTADPATNLVFIKADAKNIGVVTFGDSKKLQVGEKILFLAGSSMNYSANFVQTSVYSSQQEVFNKIFDADFPTRTFGAQAAGELIPGQAIVNLEGEVVGVWDGKGIVSSDVIRGLTNSYFNNGQKLVRPMYGFTFRTITPVESRLLNLPEGARVEKVNLPKGTAPALQVGDLITAVNDAKISEDTGLEELLQKFKPGDQPNFTVVRGTETLKLPILVQELK